MQSALNQLFDATIPLPTLSPDDLSKVSVKVASPPMFNEFGLDRAANLANLVFSIQYDPDDRVYVKVVSTQPIREPSLAFLLEFIWPRGKTFREFTVLLDPVQRLSKRATGRTKTVLNTPEPSAEPAATAQPIAAPVVDAVATPFPVETAVPSSTSKAGDVYGPVRPGEGLWGIALKVRPEGVTREEMMQALFKANPQAFSSVGIAGLKTGARLRIPTYQEIADSTGSVTARRLAALEASVMPAVNDTRLGTRSAAPAETAASEVEAFPLAAVSTPEPVAAPESLKPAASPAAVEPESAAAATMAASKPEAPEFADEVTPALKPLFPETVSATPLLSLAVSEILAAAIHAPVAMISVPMVAAPSAAPLSVETEPQPVEAPTSPLPAPTIAEAAESRSTELPAPPAAALSVDARPQPDESSAALPEQEAVSPPVAPSQPVDSAYKPGSQYGPITANERLWDIATIVRPDPRISKDVMMKALFMANPQAFSRPNMDYLREGALLRIPTLQEIIQHTGSIAAETLLEQSAGTQAATPDDGQHSTAD